MVRVEPEENTGQFRAPRAHQAAETKDLSGVKFEGYVIEHPCTCDAACLEKHFRLGRLSS